ncbi:hypothetical protein [Kitasatospora azatica]|uniref:hypothetical protein n=1 Tax=Kitasatospora azatica TaxID=58347 RepID=UPI00055CC213|nr:hypothetical protein [Kitasatospora azatica]
MRVLAYEGRRLLGLRSSWLILASALLAQVAVTAVLARRAAAAASAVPDAVRLVTATMPLVPVPLAVLAAGLLGTLASAHEVRYPGLAAAQVRYGVRLRLLLAKLAVVGAVAALFAVASLLANALTLRLVWAPSGSAARLLASALLHADHRPLPLLLSFAALMVAAGWTGVLAAALTRSAAAGFLLLCALPMLVDLAAAAPVPTRLRAIGRTATDWARGAGWAGSDGPSALGGTVPAFLVQALDALLLPAVLLLAVCLLVQLRRRSF